MRTLTDHKLNGLNDAISITVCDAPGPGGANHAYFLQIFPERKAEAGTSLTPNPTPQPITLSIAFQNGPICEAGFNGMTNEALVAIVIDRMRGFQYGRKEDGTFDEAQRGKYACRENALALTDLESALMWLQKRTRDRLARGVEGTHKV